MAYYDIPLATNRYYKLPYVHLFKALLILQDVDECEKEFNVLSKKLEKLFKKVKDSKGYKTADGLKYHYTGLCEYFGEAIVLSPWESAYIKKMDEEVKTPVIVEMAELAAKQVEAQANAKAENENKPKVTRKKGKPPANWVVVRNHYNLMWYVQVKMAAKSKLSLAECEQTNSGKDRAKLQIVSNLSPEEEALLSSTSLGKMRVTHGRRLCSMFRIHEHSPSKRFFFLNDDEVNAIVEEIDRQRGNDEWAVANGVSKIINGIKFSPETHKMVDFKDCWELKKVNSAGYSYTAYEVKYSAYDMIMEQIDKIEDEKIDAVLKKVGIR